MWIFDEFFAWLEQQLVGAIEVAFDLVIMALLAPQVYLLPQVAAIRSQALMIVNTGFVVAVLAAGVVVMTRGSLQQRYGPAELIPRLVIGFLAANFSDPIIRFAIDATNAVTLALTSGDVTTDGSLDHLARLYFGEDPDPLSGQYVLNLDQALLTTIIVIATLVLLFQVAIGWFVRLGVLILLAGVAPVALGLHATPWTDGAARLWWRTLLGCLGTVLLQALAVHTGASVLLNPDASLTALGVPNGNIYDLIIFLVILVITVKIPALMARYLTGTGGSSRAVWLLMTIASLGRGFAGRRGPGRSTPPPRSPPRTPPRITPPPTDPTSPTRSPIGPGPVRPNQPPTFSHRTPPRRPWPRPRRLQPMPLFSNPQPPPTPVPAAGTVAPVPVFTQPTPPAASPGWKPTAAAPTTAAFSHQTVAEPPATTPAAAGTPLPGFTHQAPAGRPTSTPAGLEREPLFSHAGWRRGGQPATRPAGTPARGNRPGGGWPSVAVYPTPAGRPHRPVVANPQVANPATPSNPQTPDGRTPPGAPPRRPTTRPR